MEHLEELGFLDIELIGRGGTSKIYRAIDPLLGDNVILKAVDIAVTKNISGYDEVAILQALKGTYGVLSYYDSFIYQNTLFIETEYVKGPELYELIAGITPNGSVSKEHPLKYEQIRQIFKELTQILIEVHKKGIIHRDLKPENIIIRDMHPIIIDWGHASRYPVSTFSSRGSFDYAPPEVLCSKQAYIGPENDVWSLGVVMYAMLTGKLPFFGTDKNIVRSKILNCEVSYYHKNISADVYTLLSKILIPRKQRASLSEVIDHHWVQNKVQDQRSWLTVFKEGWI